MFTGCIIIQFCIIVASLLYTLKAVMPTAVEVLHRAAQTRLMNTCELFQNTVYRTSLVWRLFGNHTVVFYTNAHILVLFVFKCVLTIFLSARYS
jgi:hypothetical protein